ncbi:MAG: alpha/beta family hydrolase [Gammaproteobacteria bacterium]|nr:alpha/beta family hydrolase [Gammaproteobacteria bacterium]
MSVSRQPVSEKLLLDGPAGKLEALLEVPADVADGEREPRQVALVCHPHPLHQGTMHNKVAHMLARSFVQLGAPALRFNFRGVGKSEGAHDNGIGEVDDAAAAMRFLVSRWPRAEKWLGGFSFGSQVSLSFEQRETIDWLVTVAPPIDRLDLENFPMPQCPWLVVQGEQDELFDARQVESWVKGLEPPPAFEMFAEADHFFHGKLNSLREAIVTHAPA